MARPAHQPEDALRVLATRLRDDDTVISPHVREPNAEPALSLLAAAGPRAREAPGEYALVVEAVREGYLLHYGQPRIISGADRDLALLAGDYLYALGLERLAALGDLGAVAELSDLISLCAQLHAGDGAAEDAAALWLACVVAVVLGPSPAHEAGKESLRAGRRGAGAELVRAALAAAADADLDEAVRHAAEAVGFPASDFR